MNHFLQWGQGPRPDLLQEDLLRKHKNEERFRKDPEDAEHKNRNLKPDRKDGVALILALFQLLLPWILGGLLLFFVAVFLLARIGGP